MMLQEYMVKNRNSKIKFINFNNFKKEYKHLFMYDLMFKKKQYENIKNKV